ncbi:MAG: SCO family protein [Kordiimonadales bacterium]|nr:MAG: SCO family protein [Kordiimonadales bacterium]
MKIVRLVAWVAVLLFAGWYGYQYILIEKPAVSGAQGELPGGAYTLTAHTGKKVSDTDFRGKYTLVYFGYSYCPDVCRIELHKLTTALELMEKSGYDTSIIQPVFISIDPERDTVSELADYVLDYHPSLIALTGTVQEIDAVGKQYRIYYKKRVQEGVDGYLMDHQSYVFVMDQDGIFERLFTGADTPQDIMDAFLPVLKKL